jgi:hypothetical protein
MIEVQVKNSGKIKGHKVGRSWVVRDFDAKQWLESRKP